jgi:hypothetical protein
MDNSRRVVVSASAFVCTCFFLPWIQVSCVGLKDSASGFDLAREGSSLLWLLPVLMIAVVGLGFIGLWKQLPFLFGLMSSVGGLISAYLMYREYSRTDRAAALIAAQWTAWFWLGMVASLVVTAGAFVFYARRSRDP